MNPIDLLDRIRSWDGERQRDALCSVRRDRANWC
jgi:hypothetical protein